MAVVADRKEQTQSIHASRQSSRQSLHPGGAHLTIGAKGVVREALRTLG